MVQGGKGILRTRAKFDCPWSVVGVADVDKELVDKAQLTAWLALGGRRIGLGDWRPEKSGVHGRFDVEDVTELTAGGAAARPSRRGRRAASAGKRGRARQSEALRSGLAGVPSVDRALAGYSPASLEVPPRTAGRRGLGAHSAPAFSVCGGFGRFGSVSGAKVRADNEALSARKARIHW